MTAHAYWEGDDVPQPGDDDDAGRREEEERTGPAYPVAAGPDAEERAKPEAEIERLFPFRAEPSPGGEVAAEEEPAPAAEAEPRRPDDVVVPAEPREKEEPPEEIAAQGESLVTTPVTPYPVPEPACAAEAASARRRPVEPAGKKARRHKGTPISKKKAKRHKGTPVRKKKAKKSKGRKRKATKPGKKARSARTVSSS
jgi:hypothetical protein